MMKFNFSIKTLAVAFVMGMATMTPVVGDDTPLGKEMDELSGSLKGLRKAETWADKVALAQKGQVATLNSLKHLPVIFKDIKDEAEKKKATADYKRLMGLTYVGLCELEMAFLAEDEDKSDAAIDKLKELKKEGHRAYTED